MSKEIKLFTFQGLRDNLSPDLLNALKANFRQYKEGKGTPSNFGRDVPYDFPAKLAMSGLWHIHIKDKRSNNWALKKVCFDKTSNTALVYCSGFFNPNYYLLIGLIENAHDVYKNNETYLLELSDIADKFRNKY